jgi:flavin-dependent dehydrogenase
VNDADIIVIGAGLSGLAASLELAGKGHSVIVLERHPFPRHKVCGEYLSMEVEPLLTSFGIDTSDACRIDRFELSGPSGRTTRIRLPLGGLGISRYALDYRLYQRALALGVRFIFEKVLEFHKTPAGFEVTSTKQTLRASLLIGAWGKRSSMDRATERAFWQEPTPWMAVKTHYKGADYPSDQVGLYVFRGGYAGCSLTENGHLNFCYLIRKDRFKETGNPEACNRELLSEHPILRAILGDAQAVFERPLSISEISFSRKEVATREMIYTGDAARLIHPLCGNGMAMALLSGKLSGELTHAYLRGAIPNSEELARAYRREWSRQFSRRLGWGRILQAVLTKPRSLEFAALIGSAFPSLLRQAIAQTHGKPAAIETI